MSYERYLFELAIGQTLDVSAATNTLTNIPSGPVLLEQLVAQYTSDANAGNRAVVFEILDAADAVLATMAGDVAQAASLLRSYVFARNAPADAAFVNDTLQRPTHLYRLDSGWKLRVRDTATVSSGDSIRILATLRPIRTQI